MGKRGVAPKPTVLRLLHGDRPSLINTDEPKPDDGSPECPPEVSVDVRKIWDYTIHQLGVMGIATPADRDALLCYCEAVVTHRRACAILAKSQVLVPGAIPGAIVRNPAIQVQRDSSATIRMLASEFGLTPSARSEIRKSGAENAPQAARYLNA